jgi:hypothetical protein
MYESGRILFGGFVSPFGAMRLIGVSTPAAYVVQALFSVIAAIVVAIVWRRRLSAPVRNAVLASATLVAIPLSLLYDMMLGAIAGCWLLRGARGEPMPAWEKTVLAAIYLLMLDSRGLAEQIALPVNTICALTLFGLATRRAARELGVSAAIPARASMRSAASTR